MINVQKDEAYQNTFASVEASSQSNNSIGSSKLDAGFRRNHTVKGCPKMSVSSATQYASIDCVPPSFLVVMLTEAILLAMPSIKIWDFLISFGKEHG